MPVSVPLLSYDGTPANGVSEVQRLTKSGTVSGGSFTLEFGGDTTPALDFDSTAAEIQAALEDLAAIGEGNVVGAGGPVHAAFVSITFAGALAGLNVDDITVDDGNLTGSTPAIAQTVTTAGVRGTYRGAQAGALLQDTDGGVLYLNTGTATVPAWSDFSQVGV